MSGVSLLLLFRSPAPAASAFVAQPVYVVGAAARLAAIPGGGRMVATPTASRTAAPTK